jgi:hypothetical protein
MIKKEMKFISSFGVDLVHALQARQEGQVLLIVVLTMIVTLTVGLSVASRTITNLKISSQNEESQKAFQAAEAGIEQALRTGSATLESTFENQATYGTEIEEQAQQAIALNGGLPVDQARGIDIWLAEYNEDPALSFQSPWTGLYRLFWGEEGQSCSETSGEKVPAALEVIILSGDINNPTVTKHLYDPCRRIPHRSANTVTGTYEEDGEDYIYRVTAPGDVENGFVMKVIPIFNSARIAVRAHTNPPLPSQGKLITSTGSSGDTERKIQYFQSYPQIPNEIFPYSIISQ